MKDIKENFEILGTSSRENFSNILHTSSISEFLKLTNATPIFGNTQRIQRRFTTCTYHRRFQNPVKHLRWSVLRQQLTAYSRQLFSQKAPF